MEAVRDREADAVVAVGNTAATVAVSWFTLGRLEGVPRPGIAVPIPRWSRATLRGGRHGRQHPAAAQALAVYGLMASRYSERIFGPRTPRWGS